VLTGWDKRFGIVPDLAKNFQLGKKPVSMIRSLPLAVLTLRRAILFAPAREDCRFSSDYLELAHYEPNRN
jgi:hypothetical protein